MVGSYHPRNNLLLAIALGVAIMFLLFGWYAARQAAWRIFWSIAAFLMVMPVLWYVSEMYYFGY